MIIGSALLSMKILEKLSPSLKQILPIAFLTFIIPLLGATFGAPNMGIKSILTLIGLGLAGGAVWGVPFAVWNRFKNQKETIIIESE